LYIWEKYRTFEITSGIILKMNLPLYKGFTLEITNKWWPLTALNRWPLYQIKIYSKMHWESTKVTVMSRWPLYKGDRYDRFDCIWLWGQRSRSHKGHYGMWHTALWSCTHIPNKYYLKNNYLTFRSKVKVPRRSLRYATHRLMVMHPHTKYNWPISKR
jgi:hypothetical protein